MNRARSNYVFHMIVNIDNFNTISYEWIMY